MIINRFRFANGVPRADDDETGSFPNILLGTFREMGILWMILRIDRGSALLAECS